MLDKRPLVNWDLTCERCSLENEQQPCEACPNSGSQFSSRRKLFDHNEYSELYWRSIPIDKL